MEQSILITSINKDIKFKKTLIRYPFTKPNQIKKASEYCDKIYEEVLEYLSKYLNKKHNLDWYPIEYEICDYKEMIGHMAYTGLPTHYRHWSFGKSFDRIQTEYNLGMSGLPYEMIINSNPSISYLMTENPMPTHILTMAVNAKAAPIINAG